MATTQGSEIEVVNLLLHLHSQVWCVWACGGNIHTDDDNVWNTGPDSNYERPGQRKREHCVDTESQEEEKRHL